MGYSTTIKLAYGFDAADHKHLDALADEGEFDELLGQLGIGRLIEIEHSGDARSEIYPVVVLKKYQHTADVYDVTNVSKLKEPTQDEKDALEKLANALGIQVDIGWVLFGNVF